MRFQTCRYHPGRHARNDHPCEAVINRETKEKCGWTPDRDKHQGTDTNTDGGDDAAHSS